MSTVMKYGLKFNFVVPVNDSKHADKLFSSIDSYIKYIWLNQFPEGTYMRHKCFIMKYVYTYIYNRRLLLSCKLPSPFFWCVNLSEFDKHELQALLKVELVEDEINNVKVWRANNNKKLLTLCEGKSHRSRKPVI